MSDPIAALLDLCWDSLHDGLSRADAPGRLPVMATVSPDGLPQARTVVLRAADRLGRWAEVHTDAASSKVDDLRGKPHAALCIWDAPRNLQIRIAARVSVLTGPAAATHWAGVPASSRAGYGAVPPPGTPIDGPLAYRRHATPDGHAVLHLTFAAIELLTLGPPQRRALLRAEDGWAGQWLSP